MNSSNSRSRAGYAKKSNDSLSRKSENQVNVETSPKNKLYTAVKKYVGPHNSIYTKASSIGNKINKANNYIKSHFSNHFHENIAISTITNSIISNSSIHQSSDECATEMHRQKPSVSQYSLSNLLESWMDIEIQTINSNFDVVPKKLKATRYQKQNFDNSAEQALHYYRMIEYILSNNELKFNECNKNDSNKVYAKYFKLVKGNAKNDLVEKNIGDYVEVCEDCPLVENSCPLENIIAFASFDEYLEHLISYKTSDAQVFCFITTFSSFSDAKTILDKLIEKWNLLVKSSSKSLNLIIIRVLKLWIEHYPSTFQRSENLKADLIGFLDSIKDRWNLGEWMKNVAIPLLTLDGDSECNMLLNFYPYKTILLNAVTDISVLDIHPLDFAKQMCILEISFLYPISLDELLSEFWLPNESHCPNLSRLKRFSNHFSQWVGSEILYFKSPIERAIVLMRFVIIALYCLELKNYNTAYCIYKALTFSAISRLKETWNRIPDIYQDAIKRIEIIFYERPWKMEIESCLIPDVGRLLLDLTEISKLPKFTENGDINVMRLYGMSFVIARIIASKGVRYPFKIVTEIHYLIMSKERFQNLIELSFLREPIDSS